jgi:hypothetical protein
VNNDNNKALPPFILSGLVGMKGAARAPLTIQQLPLLDSCLDYGL